jgi:hypothetical protein
LYEGATVVARNGPGRAAGGYTGEIEGRGNGRSARTGERVRVAARQRLVMACTLIGFWRFVIGE